MKTKAIICGVVVAAISTFVMSRAHAQAQDVPAIKIISTDQSDIIKVIYGYKSASPVAIKFTSSEGLVYEEMLSGKNVEKGFFKRFNVAQMKSEDLWVEVADKEISATFKMTATKNGKWTAQLQKVTHNFPVLALN
jgi:hypothetical protein